MSKGYKITLGVTVLAALGVAVIYFAKNKRKKRTFARLDKIADEGYETAADILFPLKNTRSKKNKNKYFYNYEDFSSN